MAVAAGFASCQKSEEIIPDAEGSLEVVFTSGISTRASGTLWEEGDAIGAFMYESGESSAYVGSSNVQYTLDSGAGTSTADFTAEAPLYFIRDKKADFVAYYPYSESAAGGVLSITTADQSSDQKIEALDYMVARTADCDEESGVTSLQFSRMMSRIIITITRMDNKVGCELSDLTIKSIATDGSCTFENSSSNGLVAASIYSEIEIFEDENNQIEAIIIPQQSASATLYMVIDGAYYTASMANTFEAGKQYNFNLAIRGDKVELSAGSINNWDEEESGELGTEKS